MPRCFPRENAVKANLRYILSKLGAERSHSAVTIGIKRGIMEVWLTRKSVKQQHLEFAAGFGRL
jgi:hypothetical protein